MAKKKTTKRSSKKKSSRKKSSRKKTSKTARKKAPRRAPAGSTVGAAPSATEVLDDVLPAPMLVPSDTTGFEPEPGDRNVGGLTDQQLGSTIRILAARGFASLVFRFEGSLWLRAIRDM